MQRLSMSCIVASSPDTMSRIDMPLVSNERTPTAFTGPQTPQGLSSTNIPPPPQARWNPIAPSDPDAGCCCRSH
ncbi:hypothetical protein HBH77_033070 [Parastagonospora nodorum]|nr:hypothetical protein HBH43_051340 [Parastagonospora nodorum]KAH5113034.1 hypothetical protein HBH72_007870 [Parastagonospora nodorum]KAH5222993.1 hypothetical protein HBH77_033070 [Parastagonospora nodorum]